MKKWSLKIISMVLVIATLMSVVPLNALAANAQGAAEEVYVESIKMAQAKTREEAKALLEIDGYIFYDYNLNEGTGNDGIWLGYKTTTDPTKAIYDIKLMNAKGGYTLTSMKDALESQKTSFTQMAVELNYLVQEFAEAYREGSVAAQKAYKALNFFRVVEGETEYPEENGLGYQLVNSKMTIEKLTEMLLFCDTTIFDTVIKTLTMGIQLRSGNWLEELSELGPYDSEKTYAANETELKQRAKQLLVIFQLYAQSYKAMDAVGIFKEMDESVQGGNNQGSGEITQSEVTATQQDMATVDMARAAIYKVLFEDLATYSYGTGTLKDFFLSFAEGGNEKALYPLVSILTDGEFAALSYGCVLEMLSGAGAAVSDFDDYDKNLAEVTKNEEPIYLYMGVNPALLKDETVVGFTEEASRDMALTGEYQFYEKESKGEDIWETGRNVALAIQGVGGVMIGVAKGALLYMSVTGSLASLTATTATGILAGIAKVCAFIGGSAFPIIIAVAALIVAAYAYIRYLVDEYHRTHLDWEKYPIPEYMYDVQEVGFTSTSQNDGLAAEYMKTTSYVFYEVVRSVSGKPMDLNAFSTDAAQWIAMYVSYDRPGDNAKPIKASEFKVKTGNGEAPEGYTPVSRFGEVRAYNLNIWDDDDSTNGLYLFYQQDKDTAVKSDRTYYISKLFLQTGESEAHCVSLLEAADYIPFNLNLTPNYSEGFLGSKRVYTYLGYKLTDNAREAITDIRIEYGAAQSTIQYGGITYAECGTSGIVTLYATKFEGAGSPILAGGLMCVNDRDDAPAGYEPVNFLAGGPAQSINTASGGLGPGTTPYFLYFLPQTTFTGGAVYLGGVTYYHYDDLLPISVKLVNDEELQTKVLAYLKEKTGRDYPCDTYDQSEIVARDYALVSLGYPIWESDMSNYNDTVLLYPTHNPYRAVYDVKGSGLAEVSDSLMIESQGYRVWKTTHYESVHYAAGISTFCVYYGGCSAKYPLKLSANLYLSGNPSKDNVYVKGTNGESGMMSDVQPIHMSDVICLDAKDEADALSKNSPYHVVTDYFSTNAAALTVKREKGTNQFHFYIAKEAEEKPYISSITVADTLTLYRGMGGASAGLKRSKITEGMLLAQLAGQGATYFAGLSSRMYGTPYVLDLTNDRAAIDIIKFGYTRTTDVDQALRDVFIYFGGVSADKPPREIYRGNVQYKLLCEIPYNLTGYEGAPRPVLGLYGTTDSRAGSPIVDIDFTETPFQDGYSAVRTQNGRSMWAEITDYVNAQKLNHFMSGAQTFFNRLLQFFSFDFQGGEASIWSIDYDVNSYNADKSFYIQIKREQEIVKPYISELYLKNRVIDFSDTQSYGYNISPETHKALLDNLFDQGAEGFVNVDLNRSFTQKNSRCIYLGYRRTANPNEAITAIRAAHDGGNRQTRDVGTVTYHLVENLSLNDQMSGDKIYLYYTKSQDPSIGSPISDIIPTVSTEPSYYTTDTAEVLPVMRYDSWKPSNLNAGTGSSAVYLSVVRPFETPYGNDPVINYGKDQTTTRKTPAGKAEGKYIAAVYVMDKNTIRQEKLAQGVASDKCTCDKITDQEVFDRLKAMGATAIIETPINISGSAYGKNNANKVYIGYSRTDKAESAIKRIAIQTDVLALAEPAETKTIKGYEYDLVAEDAKRVTQLPRAINLIGTQDGQDLLAPRMYLYTSKEGKDEPIREIVIDKTPLRDGWVTVASETGINPFADLYEEAKNHAKLGSKDDSDSNDGEIVYTDELYKWMDEVADIFNPADSEVAPFYIHCKKFDGNSIEDTLPYIEKIFIAYSDSQNEAIAKLIAYEPDGFVDYDLNRNAGWPYIYIAYKRTASRANAITDLAVFTGSNPADSKRIVVGNGVDARYDLVANVDLNKGVRGSYLYLYATTNSAAGEPIKNLRVSNDVVNKKGNGIMESTVMIAENAAFTKTAADLNKNVGLWSDYIYLVMKRDAPASNVGALIATGSWIAIGVLAGAGIACAVVVFAKKKKTKVSDENTEA